MAQLKTEAEVLAQPLGTKLYTINPFGCGYKIQHKVSLKVLSIDKVIQIDGGNVVCSIVLDNNQRYPTFKVNYDYISSLVSKPKFVFNDLNEATAKLEEVRQGLCVDVVREHHESCESYQL